MNNKNSLRLGLAAVLLSLCCASPLRSQDMPVPAEMQASLFKKIFAYSKKLAAIPDPKVIVAFSDSSAAVKDELIKAFQGVRISAKGVKADQLGANVSDASAVYICAGAVSAKAVCQKNRILSITGIPALVESGSAAIGLDVIDKKPKILVNLARLKEEGQEISAKLLQLAKVID